MGALEELENMANEELDEKKTISKQPSKEDTLKLELPAQATIAPMDDIVALSELQRDNNLLKSNSQSGLVIPLEGQQTN